MRSLFYYKKLLGHVVGSSSKPSSMITVDNKLVPNPIVDVWNELDHKVVILLHVSLIEEMATEIMGLSTILEIWNALEFAYNNHSVERVNSRRDKLCSISKGTNSVADFARKFKGICDQ